MNTAAIGREYLQDRIDHYTQLIDDTDPKLGGSNGVLLFQYKSIRTELVESLKVLNGGKSIFQINRPATLI